MHACQSTHTIASCYKKNKPKTDFQCNQFMGRGTSQFLLDWFVFSRQYISAFCSQIFTIYANAIHQVEVQGVQSSMFAIYSLYFRCYQYLSKGNLVFSTSLKKPRCKTCALSTCRVCHKPLVMNVQRQQFSALMHPGKFSPGAFELGFSLVAHFTLNCYRLFCMFVFSLSFDLLKTVCVFAISSQKNRIFAQCCQTLVIYCICANNHVPQLFWFCSGFSVSGVSALGTHRSVLQLLLFSVSGVSALEERGKSQVAKAHRKQGHFLSVNTYNLYTSLRLGKFPVGNWGRQIQGEPVSSGRAALPAQLPPTARVPVCRSRIVRMRQKLCRLVIKAGLSLIHI